MKLLWLCNSAPGVVRSAVQGKPVGAVNWVDHVLSGLRQRGITLRILYRGSGGQGQVDEQCTFSSFAATEPWVYRPELEETFRQELRNFQPDVIHSWGVEFDHALAMANAAEKENMLPRMVASIQGLCAFLAEHYCDGISPKVCRANTPRDLIQKDNILRQQEKFRLRGQMERQCVEKLHHVIGRTAWDRKCTIGWNPGVQYHFCNETLRESFYDGQWNYAACKKHSVFASSCVYPIKGFHYLLQAMAEVKKHYPDATITVTGRSFLSKNFKYLFRRGTYEAYLSALAKVYQLDKSIRFLGNLSAQQMKAAYLDANVFVLPSALENSPNSLAEAMLLGVPCVAARVGGVPDLMGAGEGCVYEPGDIAALAKGIMDVFAAEDQAASLGRAAQSHARQTHDPETNLETLLQIYQQISAQK